MPTVKVEYCLGTSLKFASVASVLMALGVGVVATSAIGAQTGVAQVGMAETPVAARIDHAAIPVDSAVRRGVLPNGLRYLVMRNASPKGAVSLRFGVDVGSYEEADSERGLAHFVEHMAFRSTRKFGDSSPEKIFSPWGVAFGRDQNAFTSQFATLYQLDIPKPDTAQLTTGLGWLRDVADGIVFTDETVARERGVVLAEMEARSSPQLATQEAIGQFQAGGQRSMQRSPIGTKTSLDAATAAGLKRFHDRWYRPEHAVVTLAGDLPVDDMEAMVRQTFSSWVGQGPKPVRAPIVQIATSRGVDAFTLAGPTLPTALSACRLKPGEPIDVADTVDRLRRTVRTQIWQSVLNQRLAQRVSAGDAHLLGAGAFASDARDVAFTCLVVMPTGEAWEPALRAAQAEMNRFAKEGPTEIETETATEQLRALLRGALLNAGSRSSSSLADSLIGAALSQKVVTDPAGQLYAYDLAVEDLTPADIKAAFAADWSGSGPLLAMTAPKPASREALLAAWTQGAGESIQTAYADRAALTWGYSDFGALGKVIQRDVVADPGFTRLRFANGLVLNFKQIDQEPNKVEVRLNFGAGRREIDDRDYFAAELGSTMLVAGGVGKHRFEDIQAMFASKASWNFALGIGPSGFGLRSTTFSDGLRIQLGILAAYMTDPGFNRALDERLPTAFDVMYRTYATQPAGALEIAMAESLAPGAPSNLPSRDVMSHMRSADFERVLKPILTTAPLELTIVGDLDEAKAVQAAAATFGALPARPTGPRERGQPRFMRYPEGPVPTLRIAHDGPANKAAAALIWPLYVSTPERRREEYALKLLAAVFDTALRQRVREELGKTYAPDVSTTGPDQGDQGVLRVSIDAEPQDIETLVTEARAVAERLKAGGITEAMLDSARQPILASARARRETDDWWAGAMGGSAKDQAVLDEALLYEPLMSSLTLQDVQSAAATWLKRDPIVGLAFPRATSPAKGAAQ
ncbi:insulinase family protein [soil metagenome]